MQGGALPPNISVIGNSLHFGQGAARSGSALPGNLGPVLTLVNDTHVSFVRSSEMRRRSASGARCTGGLWPMPDISPGHFAGSGTH